MKVSILVGASGSGKTTWISEHLPQARIVSADLYFLGSDGHYHFRKQDLNKAHGSCLRLFVEALQQTERDVVVDNTNTTVEALAPYVSLARAYGWDVDILIFRKVYQNVHGTPPEKVMDMRVQVEELLKGWPSFWPPPQLIS